MPLEDLPSHFIDLVHDALLKSFWRKNALLNFLRRHKISQKFLATWDESETKRAFLARLLPKLEDHERGSQILKQMAVSLADQVKFPDLEGWEDTPQKLQAAKNAIEALRKCIDLHKEKAEELKAREETKKIARQRLQETISKRQTLESLSGKLNELAKRLGTQALPLFSWTSAMSIWSSEDCGRCQRL